ncbi:oligoribonuclease [Cupriavidus taiwanensis]|uniref:Oligoribonuclease n=2 Tax=Burkholderiaceae TaxID=119060 RepID=A0A375CWM1_9BURK|nr:oligoribonuclease [Cupriavidus taiwanensis]SOY82496.1 oligoribonuclease [Cupriavidus taiwanensis]SPD65308.1 Oligoribonuclease [Cupriavidus taiwanensis]
MFAPGAAAAAFPKSLSPAVPMTSQAAAKSVKSENNLIWLDMEMTGLQPDTDRIIEVAVVITDSELNILAEGPVLVIHQSDAVLDGMDNWNKGTHGRSGLIDKVKASTLTEEQAEAELLAFLKRWVPAGKSPMCGNSICQDRRFMARYMPKLEAFFHYRNLDVSTLKELCKRWEPAVHKGFVKRQLHTALADILESVEELRYYRTHFIRHAAPGAAPSGEAPAAGTPAQ